MENLTGQTIKGYEMQERIGAGGFGAVYRARQTTVGREVAIKIILPGFANKPNFIRRFEAEAQLIARLEHLHITPLYDYWRDPSGAYLVMRFLRGGSLRETIEQGSFALNPAAQLLDQVASALALAHRNEIIHRDIKPGNILLDEDGNAYLADFGIAKVLGELPNDLTEGGLVGSLDYISPEQARSEPISPQTDIYSLGVVLYEILTGEHPFPNSTSVERLYKHLNDPIPRITTLNGEGEAVNKVIQKATAKNPAIRYADVIEFAIAFRAAANLVPAGAGESIVEQLTLREQEVLHLLVEGKSNREISQILVVTLSTVKWYVNQLYRKLGVRNRVQAIVRAREMDLVIPGSLSEEYVGEVDESAARGNSSVILPEPTNPYKGLRAFQPADHRHFFGRDKLIKKLVEHLTPHSLSGNGDGGESLKANHRFLAVVGPSGSGKSSLVKAGLIPALWRGDLPGSERWFVVEMIPGDHPLDELEIALLRVAANQSDNIRHQLSRDERGLLRVARLILPEDNTELVIVLDQFEEVFTLVESEAERVQFLNLLLVAVSGPRSRVRVILTLRADFYDRPLHYPEFGELVHGNMETILPPSAEELTNIIRKPAELVGVTFEAGLVPAIIEEIHYQPGALPLLQYALTELFDRREGRFLTRQAYEDMGGTIGALAKRAEEIYKSLSPEGQEATRQMFLRLVILGEGVEDTRRRVAHSELLAIANHIPSNSSSKGEVVAPLSSMGRGVGSEGEDLMDELLDTFTAYRLLSLDTDPVSRTPTVEVAHEAILREWERLRGWLDDSRTDIRLQRQLNNAATEWQANDKEPSYLLRGARLDQFEGWYSETELALTPSEETFLTASFTERDRELAEEAERQEKEMALERRLLQRFKAIVVILTAAILLGLALTAAIYRQSRIAQRNAEEAQQGRSANLAILAQNELEDENTDLALSLALAANGIGIPSEDVQRILLDVAYAPGTRLVFTDHQEGVLSTQITPDGQYALTGSRDGQIFLWALDTGEVVRSYYAGINYRIRRLLISPDGTQFLVGYSEGKVVLWELETGEMVYQKNLHSEGLNDISISTDGRMGISGGATARGQGELVYFDLATGREVLRFGSGQNGHPVEVDEVEILPGGRTVLASSGDGIIGSDAGDENNSLILWDLERGELLQHYELTTASITRLTVNPIGSTALASARDFNIYQFDLETGEVLHILEGHRANIWAIDISPDGRTALTGDGTGDIIWWDLSTGSVIRHFRGNTAEVRAIRFSPDSRHFLSAYQEKNVRYWDLYSAWELARFGTPEFHHGGSVVHAEISPDGRLALTASGRGFLWFDIEEDNSVILWDYETGRPLWRLEGHTDTPGMVRFFPDSKRAVSASYDGTMIIWDLETGQIVHRFTGDGSPFYTFALSPDGRWGVTGSWEKSRHLVRNMETGEILYELYGHQFATYYGNFSQDSRYVLLSGTDQPSATATIWDLETGLQVARYMRYYRNPHVESGSLLSPDNRFMLTGGLDGTLSLWDLESDEMIQQYIGHENVTLTFDFLPSGERILSSSWDGTLILWDLKSGRILHRFGGAGQGHRDAIYGLDIAPDSKTALSTSINGSIIKWQIEEPSPKEVLDWITANRYIAGFTCAQRQTYQITPLCDENGDLPEDTLNLLEAAQELVPEIQPVNADSTNEVAPVPIEPIPWPVHDAVIGEQRGEIPLGGYESWMYYGSAGEKLTITMLADHPITLTNQVQYETRFDLGLLDPELWVIGPNGKVVGENMDRDRENFDFNAQIVEIELPADGIYRIEARSHFEETAGPYMLIIQSYSEP